MIETISGVSVAVVALLVLEVAAATSTPMTSFPSFRGAVNMVGSILKLIVETWPAVVTVPGMIANVLPSPALKTMRSSRTSG